MLREAYKTFWIKWLCQEAMIEHARTYAIPNRWRRLMSARKTAEEILDFFVTRAPCRVVVIEKSGPLLDWLWVELRDVARMFLPSVIPDYAAYPPGSGNHLIVKMKAGFKCPLSYIAGYVESTSHEAFLGHHIPSLVPSDGQPRTMAVVRHDTSPELIEKLHTWANVVMLVGNDEPTSDQPILVKE